MKIETLPYYVWWITIPILLIGLYVVSLKLPLRNFLNFLFRLLSDLVNDAEKSFQDFLMAIVPYAVPIIPAYLTIDHVHRLMGFPEPIAWTAGFVVETFGIVSITTAIRFFYHNKRYAKEQNKAPFLPALLAYLFYILVVITVNVILEWQSGTRSGWVVLTIALFTLLSVPSGVLIAIRTQYGEVLDNIEKRYKPSDKPNQNTPETQKSGAYSQKHASDYYQKIIDLLEAEYKKSGNILTPKQITSRLKLDHGRSKGYVSTKTAEWKKSKGL